jgi:hypothetical protein
MIVRNGNEIISFNTQATEHCLIIIIFLIIMVGVDSNWVHSALLPLIGLLYLPRVIMKMENFVE